MPEIKDHVEKIIDLLIGSSLPPAMRDMVIGWLGNQPIDDMQGKLSAVKQYLADQTEI
ncbi:MAG: hypothetical protein HN929_02755 [Chloroflexi bacterium]|jgi:hypothetical protein|nr:hypothetical protein [Chloroflexota bacterium]MBT7080380.1 hypothetical protein [Chloroflexota bacterium]MBT7289450.1 hypothetical protein [Chloroflexota bacterium]